MLSALAGYRVTPNSSVQLVVIINVREAGRYEWAGLQVEYVTPGWFYSELAAHESRVLTSYPIARSSRWTDQ